MSDRLVTISNNLATMVPIFVLGALGQVINLLWGPQSSALGSVVGQLLFTLLLLFCATLSFLRFRTVRRNIATEVAGVLIVTAETTDPR